MKTSHCRCGNRIFFNNHCCVSCSATLGRCCECGVSSSFTIDSDSVICDSCGRLVYACSNQTYSVCTAFHAVPNAICKWCSYTEVIPPIANPGTVQRWAAMEAAKRRLLLQLEDLQLPPFLKDVGQEHPLRFAFKEDTADADGTPIKVVTGHQEGLITINLAEADSVHRERTRLQLGEPQRTLIGHMRHEVGHYIDWAWAARIAAEEYHRLFGDPETVDYDEALKRHYDLGAPPNWADHHVSAYATMHPWEDFAETVNVYLDIMAIATTANDIAHRGLDLSPTAKAESIVQSVLDIVVEVSEYNFDLGLMPLLPERLSLAVIEKLEYVHSLRSKTLKPQPAAVKSS